MKSVAIIGAGPAGLVAAKTLLHSYPEDAFSVSIFEHGKTIGGLWAVESDPRGIINPEMRTNLSQFTVCFSDLAWEALELSPPPNMYPKAWQANRYLAHYAQKFIPPGTVAFQTSVNAVERVEKGWRLTVLGLESNIEEVKIFDCLIIAYSGYFSKPRPINFELDGLETPAPILHSSQYRNLGDLFPKGRKASTGKILVIGGSHSGAEVAAAIALQMSDARYSSSGSGMEPLKIVHVMPHPLLAIPTFVQTGKGSSPGFMPLDSVLYDISSRKDDPISWSYGHSTPEKTKKLRAILSMLMDGAKEENDHDDSENIESLDSDPPYAVVSDNYIEFVQSGAIQTIRGRVVRLEKQEETGTQRSIGFMRARLREGSDGPDIEDIVAVVDATGFSPSPALDFLPESVKDTLGYDASYLRLPLLLNADCFTSSDTAPNNLALMGFLDSAYWGILETQARLIARKFAHDESFSATGCSKPTEKSTKLYSHMKELRSIMHEGTVTLPQGLFGDYPGLIEENSSELGLRRID